MRNSDSIKRMKLLLYGENINAGISAHHIKTQTDLIDVIENRLKDLEEFLSFIKDEIDFIPCSCHLSNMPCSTCLVKTKINEMERKDD